MSLILRASRCFSRSGLKSRFCCRPQSFMHKKEKVSFPSENSSLGECPAVLTGNLNNTTKGLVVLQEWWGMNEQIVEEASQISEQGGLITIVPDLYRGKVATDRETAGHYMEDLDWSDAMKDVAAAVKYLLSKGCKKVGVTGFCMGGALTLASAVLVPELSASAPFYGIPNPSLADVTKITIPLQCHFANQDTLVGFSSPKDASALKKKLEDGGVKFEFYTYDADHAFTNFTGPSYNKEASKLALGRMMEFMNKHLA